MIDRKEYYRNYRKQHSLKGLCVQCTSVALPGKRLCSYHKDEERKYFLSNCSKIKARARNRYREHKLRGLCGVCSNEVVPGRSKCKYHLKKESEVTLRKYNKKIGICVYGSCKENVIPNLCFCKLHLDLVHERRKIREAKWKKEGRCIGCGNVLHEEMDEGYVKCTNCRMGLVFFKYPKNYGGTI